MKRLLSFSKPDLEDILFRNFTSALFNNIQGHTIQIKFLLHFDGTVINKEICHPEDQRRVPGTLRSSLFLKQVHWDLTGTLYGYHTSRLHTSGFVPFFLTIAYVSMCILYMLICRWQLSSPPIYEILLTLRLFIRKVKSGSCCG